MPSFIRSKRFLYAAVIVLVAAVTGISGWFWGHLGMLQYNATGDNGGLIFSVASSTGDTYFVVGNDGHVGVNTLTPKTNLDVVGLIRTRTAFTPKCTPELEGAIAYSIVTKHFAGCNGIVWKVLEN